MPVRRALPFALLLLAVAGCAQANPAIQVTGVVASDAMCTVQVSNPHLLGGLYDVGAGGSYTLSVSMLNRMVTRMRAPGPLIIESDDFTLKGAVVSIEAMGAPGHTPLAGLSYTVDATGFIRAGSDTAPSEGIGAIQVISTAVNTTALQPMVPAMSFLDVRLRVQAFGDTSGGSHIDLDDFVFPLTICNGCLACAGTIPSVACHPGSNGEPYIPPGGCP